MNDSELFNAALKLSAGERAKFLDLACRDNPELRGQVEGLLRAHFDSATFLHDSDDSPKKRRMTETIAPAEPTEHTGTMIAGRYKLIEAIGEGGMGSVWLAEQKEPVRRKVAIKLIKAGMDSKSVLARFDAERQALALMDHPNIAKVYDGGVTEQGRPYFVMEYVKGIPLTEYCDQARLSLAERLKLFASVCQAVQHAHQKGIIHRDLKPTNILACLYDGQPVPKVIDFGLAKAMHQSLTDQSLFTAHGMMVGTPLYMSPEQAEHNNLDVDTRTDIYSLGVILYELLTGSTPLEKQQLKEAAFNEILRLIKEVEPPKPSTRLSGSASLPSVAAQRSIEPNQLRKSLAGDLDWIVMKALDKERSRRYETANGLARDIDRFLNDEAVEACPPSASYKLRKYFKRNRAQVIAASAVLLALVFGIIGTSWGLLRARAAEHAANLSAQAALASEQKTRTALEQETAAKERAQAAEARTLASYVASTDDTITELIGSKPELGYKERTYLEKTLNRWQKFADEQEDSAIGRHYRAKGYFNVAHIWRHLGENTAARNMYDQAIEIWQKLVEQFPDVHVYQHGLGQSRVNLAYLLTDLGKFPAARTSFEQARDILQKLVAQFPDVAQYQLDLSKCRFNLGNLLRTNGETTAARTEHEQVRDILQKLVEQFPTEPEYQSNLALTHNSLGSLLLELGDSTLARTEYDQSIKIVQTLVEQFPAVPEYQRDLATAHQNLAKLLDKLGDSTFARTEYDESIKIQQTLVEQFPAVPQYQSHLASNRRDLGYLLLRQDETSAARTEWTKSIDIQMKLVEQFPAVPDYRKQLAMNKNSLGLVLARMDETSAARTEYDQSIEILQKLVEQFPTVPDYKKHLGTVHGNLGLLHLKMGNVDEARLETEISLEIKEQLVDQFGSNLESQIILNSTYGNYGELLKDSGYLDESLPWFDKSVQGLEALFKKNQQMVFAKECLAASLEGRSQSYHRLKRYDDAIKDLDRAVELNVPPLMTLLCSDRARSWSHINLTAAAIDEATKVAMTDPKESGQYYNLVLYNLACVYSINSEKAADKQQEYADRALELLNNAITAGYDKADWIAKDPDLDPIRERDDFKQLLQSLKEKQTPSDKAKQP